MNKLIFLVIFSFLLFSCSSTKQTPKKEPILIGQISLEDLKNDNYSKWYNKNYDSYILNSKYIEELKLLSKNYRIEIYLGTWCKDSQRQLPRFIKILDSIGFNSNNLALFGLDRKKTSHNKVEQKKQIIYVPTIIIYRNNTEVNRIVEIPVETLEQDLINIITKNTYKNAYAD